MVTDTPLPILIPQNSFMAAKLLLFSQPFILFDFSSFLLMCYAMMNYEM
ncbi:unnamed protein product [Musa textilis]